MPIFDNQQQHELYDAVIWWQSIELFHPISCANSSHRPLVPTILANGMICLFCEQCDYTQPVRSSLAGVVLAAYAERSELDELTRFSNEAPEA